MQFLNGLNDAYSQVRTQILMMEPTPSIDKAFSLVIQGERQRSLGFNLSSLVEITALVVKIMALVLQAVLARTSKAMLGKEGLYVVIVANFVTLRSSVTSWLVFHQVLSKRERLQRQTRSVLRVIHLRLKKQN